MINNLNTSKNEFPTTQNKLSQNFTTKQTINPPINHPAEKTRRAYLASATYSRYIKIPSNAKKLPFHTKTLRTPATPSL